MFLKHGSPEPITYIIAPTDAIDEIAKEALEKAKKIAEGKEETIEEKK